MLSDHFVQRQGETNGPTPQQEFEHRRALYHLRERAVELDRLGTCTCPACLRRYRSQAATRP